nr:FCD domain-containing protein [Pararoseomonas baculiformis]
MGRIRVALEGVAASLVARQRAPEAIAALRARLEAIRVATEQDDPARLAEANDAFHLTLHAVTGNALLVRTLRALQAYHHISRSRVLATREERRQALAEHAAVLDRMEAGDADAAEALMRAHTLRSLEVAFPEARKT